MGKVGRLSGWFKSQHKKAYATHFTSVIRHFWREIVYSMRIKLRVGLNFVYWELDVSCLHDFGALMVLFHRVVLLDSARLTFGLLFHCSY